MSGLLLPVAGQGRGNTYPGIPVEPPAAGDFPTRVSELEATVSTWHRHAQASSSVITAEVGANGTGVNTADLTTQVGALITDGDGDSSMALGGSDPDAGGYTIPAPFQSATYWVFWRIQLDKVPTSDIVLETIGGGDNVNGEGAHKITPDGAGGATVRMEAVGPAGFSRADAATPGLVPPGQSIGLLYQRTASDLKVFVGSADGSFVEATLNYSVGSAQSWGATPNDEWHIGYFPGASGEIGGFNGLIGDRLSGSGTISNADITSLMASVGQTVLDLRDVTLPDLEEDAGEQAFSVATSVNPEAGVTLSIISGQEPAHGTAGVNGLALTFEPAAVSGNQADSFGFRATHATAGTADATASLTVLETGGGAAEDLPYFGQFFGSHGYGAGNGNFRYHPATDGNSSFFYAERTGTPTKIHWHWRSRNADGSGAPSGYSAGNGGSYTIGIKAADPVTKRPIPGTGWICRTGIGAILPGNPTTSDRISYHTYTFSVTGQLVAGQPYVIGIDNTAAGGNYVSSNASVWSVFFDQTPPVTNYVEPGDGPGVGSINVASGGIDPDNVGASPAIVRGWTPVKINGTTWYPYPVCSEGTTIKAYIGDFYAQLVHSDGTITNWGAFGSETTSSSWIYSVTSTEHFRIIFRPHLASHTVSGVFILGWRNGTSGNINVDLNSGPTTESHNPASSGTLIERVTVNVNLWLDAQQDVYQRVQQTSTSGHMDIPHWVWVPFATPRTLTQNSAYNLRLSGTNTARLRFHCNNRGDSEETAFLGQDGSAGVVGRSSTWAQWQSDNTCSWNGWIYSRGCAEASTNSGTTWSYKTGTMPPILFKCV